MTSPETPETPDVPETPDMPDADRTPDVPDAAGTPGPHRAPDVTALDLDAQDGESADEAELRGLLREAVRDIKPAPDALDHLRRAVPARRQHRRQALAGSVAALLLVGAAVPALVHATGGGGNATASPVGKADAHTSRPGEDGRANSWDTTADPGRNGQGRDGHGSGQPSATTGSRNPSAQATSPGTTPAADAPACSGDQLGNGASKAGSPDDQGRVYGWFRVANVSTSTCAMPPGTGAVQVQLLSSTGDASKITVVNHTAGDPAQRLPAAQDTAPVVLAPGQTYEVAYAWVPAATGPGGCAEPSSPPATATATPTPTDTTAESGAGAPGSQEGTDDSAPSDSTPGDQPSGGSSTAPQPGDFTLLQNSTAEGPVVVGPTVKDACAGTVYTTAPMAQTPDVTAP